MGTCDVACEIKNRMHAWERQTKPGRPDEFVNNIVQNVAQFIFVKMNAKP
jgi:hypothetical protein